MVDLAKCLGDLSAANAREVLYFLSRYFKGTPHLEEDGKDIFADVFDDEDPPEKLIRERTLEVIGLIEAEIGKRASGFDQDTTDAVLEQITAFEDSLDETPSSEDIAHASAFLSSVGGQPQN